MSTKKRNHLAHLTQVVTTLQIISKKIRDLQIKNEELDLEEQKQPLLSSQTRLEVISLILHQGAIHRKPSEQEMFPKERHDLRVGFKITHILLSHQHPVALRH